MKITQLRGDLAAFRNLELSIVLNAMKTENSRKPVTTLRQNIPYLTPGIKSLAAEKIPVVLFGVTLKREDEGIGVAAYTGLVLLSIGNLIRLEQPLQMPAPATTREVHDAEKDPLRRMAPGYECYKRISLLFETCLVDTFRQVGPEDGTEEERKKFVVHLARRCRQSAIPEEDAVRFALIHPFGREQEMELRATFGNVYRKEKHCSVRPCMPRRSVPCGRGNAIGLPRKRRYF